MPVERRVVVYELLSAQISRHQWTRPAGLDRLQWDRPSGSAQGGLLEFELDAILTGTAVADVMPFCLDVPNGRLILLEVDSLANVHAAPFEDRAVPLHATGRVFALPFAEAERWASAVTPPRAVFVWSVGRCGSTCLHRLLCAAGVGCVSEPCWFDDLCRMRMSGNPPSKELVRALHLIHWASARRLFPKATAFAMKPKSYGHQLLVTVAAAFPAASHLFVYRDARQVVGSFGRHYALQQASGAPERATPCPLRMRSAHVAAALRTHAPPPSLPALAVSFGADWADAMAHWKDEAAALTGGRTLRFDELRASGGQEHLFASLLRWAGVPVETRTLDAMRDTAARDSQEGHIMAGAADAEKRFLSDESAAALVCWLRTLSGLDADAVLPGSLLASC